MARFALGPAVFLLAAMPALGRRAMGACVAISVALAVSVVSNLLSLARHRTPKILELGTTVAFVVLATRSGDRGNDVDAVLDGVSTTVAAEAAVNETAPTEPTPETTAEPTPETTSEPSEPTRPAPVTASSVPVVETPATIIDEASYLGRRKDDVIDELEALGYIVVERKAGPIRGTKDDTVVGIDPTGSLESGSTITVLVAGGKAESED